MNNPNIKLYLGISLVLVILFILILAVPFTKKTGGKITPAPSNFPLPTSLETNPSPATKKATPGVIKADFTGVAEVTIPKRIIDLAAQKKDLLQKIPLKLTTFTIDFDYGEDKFIVTLKDPKDQALKEFESWRINNYPQLNMGQFLLK